MRRIIYLVISLFFVVNLAAQQFDKSKIDQFIKEAREKLKLKSGLAVSVVINNQIVFSEGYGYVNVEEEIEAEPDSPFYIASATKPIFATLVQILSEKDSLFIDKPISAYLPELKFEDENLNSNTISIRDMLTHRSGIFCMPAAIRTAYTGQHDFQTLVDVYKSSRFKTSEYDYTNNGYIVTSLALENKLHKPWQQLISEYMFEPLKMKNTSAKVSDYDEKYLRGYQTLRGTLETVGFLKADNIMHAAGGIITTANDLGNFLIFYLNEGSFSGEQLLSERKIIEAISPQIAHSDKFYSYDRYAYGLGWQIGEYNDEKMIAHFGSFTGSRSHISFLPEHNMGVAALTNDSGEAYYLVDLVANYIYNIYLGKDADAIAEKEIQPLITKMNSRDVKTQEPKEESNVNSSWDYNRLVGIYSNPLWGEISVKNSDQLIFSFGNIQSEMIPISEKLFVAETGPFKAKVEFVEEKGKVIQLNVLGPGKLEFKRK